MKQIQVDYFDKKLEISVPDDALVLESNPPTGHPDPQGLVRQALAKPLGMPRISELVNPGSKVTIAFDDPCRPALPRQVIIPLVLDELNAAGVKDEDITLLSANGNHCKRTREEFRKYLGDAVFHRFWSKGSNTRILNHDCADPDNLVFMGISAMGDYVEYNKLLATSDLFIYCGTVQSSNWGGMTGCGVIIGFAGARSMRSTHSWEVVGDPASCHGDQHKMLYRHHKDAIMDQIESFTGKKVFYVDAIVGQGAQVVDVYAGHYKAIQEPAWKKVTELYQVKAPQADVVVVGLPQFLLYGESTNTIMCFVGATTAPRHWVNKPLLREGGVLIGCGKCSGIINEKLHPAYREVMNLFDRCFDAGDMYDYEDEYLNRPDHIFKYTHCYGYHPIHPFWLFYESQYMLDHSSKIIMAGAENPGSVRQLGCEPARDFDAALRRAKQVVGPNPKVAVLPTFWSKPRMQFFVE